MKSLTAKIGREGKPLEKLILYKTYLPIFKEVIGFTVVGAGAISVELLGELRHGVGHIGVVAGVGPGGGAALYDPGAPEVGAHRGRGGGGVILTGA